MNILPHLSSAVIRDEGYSTIVSQNNKKPSSTAMKQDNIGRTVQKIEHVKCVRNPGIKTEVNDFKHFNKNDTIAFGGEDPISNFHSCKVEWAVTGFYFR